MQVCQQKPVRKRITDSLLRISVGIEDPQDLITDLDHAFQVAAQR